MSAGDGGAVRGSNARRGALAARLGRAGDAVGDGGSGPAERLRRQLVGRLLQRIERGTAGSLRDPSAALSEVRDLLAETPDLDALSATERARLESQLVAELCGLGPLESLIVDPTVSDVLVNAPDDVWVDRFGRLERTSVRFEDGDHVLRLLGRLVGAAGRHLDEASPTVDVRLPDGSRLHALIPPLVPHPIVSIRRLRNVPFRPEELVAAGSLTADMCEFLAAAVRSGRNIVISGGAATGKTTLLNVLSTFIPHEERVVTIEETAELRLDHPHVVAVEARLANVEGRGEISLRHLVKNSLRMRADRIIVGEVRGGEVFDMLQAMNTGHDGSLTTVHANSPSDALRRLENLVVIGGVELPSSAIRELLGATLDVVVHLTRFNDGSRRVTSVAEVEHDHGRLALRELFLYERQEGLPGASGLHRSTDERSSFESALAQAGYDRRTESGSQLVTEEEG